MRVRYAKRGRMRFASHRDIARALERSLRRARLPIAFSAGFSPHPKISYAGAAPTGVASEAEYLELTLTEPCEAAGVREVLNGAMPDGLDILDVVPARAEGSLAERLEGSAWRISLPGVAPGDAGTAVAAFLAAEAVEVERSTKKGRRSFDARGPVRRLRVLAHGDRHGPEPGDGPDHAVLLLVARHATPNVRPDDVLTALGRVAGLAPPSPPRVTRLAQGPVGAEGIGDPFAPDRRGGNPVGRTAEANTAGHAETVPTAASAAPAREARP